jgi:hypothetical protein
MRQGTTGISSWNSFLFYMNITEDRVGSKREAPGKPWLGIRARDVKTTGFETRRGNEKPHFVIGYL